MNIGGRIRKKRKEKNLTQSELGKLVNVSSQVISNWERGYTGLSHDDIAKLATALDVSTDFLLGNDSKEKLPELTPKDERDIAKDLEKILSSLDNPNEGYSYFDGQSIDDLDEEDRELLKAALETCMKIAKQIAKKNIHQRNTEKTIINEENYEVNS
ncbi:helix-turn-helix transcriptional regulator [Caldifermentibacillus hisashii]|uniref:helix-turn-helix domain-containing protein n=1 Tax=Caldifermentibacillus hisashii TaxID=996558 RepID=UPI003100EBF7